MIGPDDRPPGPANRAQAPVLSVVIPHRNGRALLAACLPPLLRDLSTLPDAEVVVVDDGSADDSLAWLASAHPEVRAVRLAAGAGFAAACNAGAWAAQAPVTAFLNNDTEVQPGWSAGLLSALERDGVAIAGGLTVFHDRPDVVNTAGTSISSMGAASDIGLGLPVDAVSLTPRAVAGVSGVSMAVRSDWFAATGGFDERLFMYSEDVELCLRAWREGYRVWFTPQSVVRHHGSASAGDRHHPLRSYYGSRNRLLVAGAYLGLPRLIVAVPVLIAQDLAAIAWLLARGHARRAALTARDRARGVAAGLGGLPAARRARAAQRDWDVSQLKRLGLIDPPLRSLQEFVRIRRLQAGGV